MGLVVCKTLLLASCASMNVYIMQRTESSVCQNGGVPQAAHTVCKGGCCQFVTGGCHRQNTQYAKEGVVTGGCHMQNTHAQCASHDCTVSRGGSCHGGEKQGIQSQMQANLHDTTTLITYYSSSVFTSACPHWDTSLGYIFKQWPVVQTNFNSPLTILLGTIFLHVIAQISSTILQSQLEQSNPKMVVES